MSRDGQGSPDCSQEGLTQGCWRQPGSSSRPGVLAPLLSDSPQICPSLEHASLVLLNSLLDTVPGK